MKRTKSLIGSIFGSVVHGIQSLVNIYMLYVMFLLFMLVNDISSSDPENVIAKLVYTILFFAVLLIELISITSFVLSCVSFSYINGTPEKYARRKGVTIALIVFNFILIVLFAIACLEPTPLNLIINIISGGLLLTSNILYLVDLKQEKKRAVQTQPAEEISPVENNDKQSINP